MSSRHILSGLQNELLTIARPTSGVNAALTDLKPVASYNWVDRAVPTIQVPGGAPIWKEHMPCKISPDTGTSFIDQNSARLPDSSPLEPLLRSVHLVEPGFDFSSLSLVTDRSNLRKLLRWIGVEGDKKFRIDVELAGDTVVLRRWEASDLDDFAGFKGFGHNFEIAQTTSGPGLSDSTGSHRIVSYSLGGMKLLVRFEIDAQLPNSTTRSQPAAEDLSSLLSSLSVASTPKPARCSSTSPLNYHLSPGTIVLSPQASLIELKTKTFKGTFSLPEIYPQLFFSQTPHLYLAMHDGGRFSSSRLTKLQLGQGALAVEARRAEGNMTRLVAALQGIVALAKKECDGKEQELALVFDGQELRAYKAVKGKRSLGPELKALFLSR